MFKQSNNNSLFGNYLYERVIPKDNFLKQLSEAVGFSLVNDICLDKYENYGKPGNLLYGHHVMKARIWTSHSKTALHNL